MSVVLSRDLSIFLLYKYFIILLTNFVTSLVQNAHICFLHFIVFSHQDTSIDLSKIERTLQMIKKGALPKTPKTVKEIAEAFEKIDVMNSYGSTLQTVDLNGDALPEKLRFFDTAYECKNYAYCVFSSKQTIELIEKNMKPSERHVLMDATFRIVPVGPFNQLLILYIRKHKKVCQSTLTQISCVELSRLLIYTLLHPSRSLNFRCSHSPTF